MIVRNKLSRTTLLLMLILSVNFSCERDNSNATSEFITIMDSGIAIQSEEINEFLFESSELDNLVQGVRYIPIMSDNSKELLKPIKVTATANNILVYDRPNNSLILHVLDAIGNSIFTLTDELIDGGITDAHLSNNAIHVLDGFNKRILKYNLTGQLIEEVSVPFDATNISYDETLKRICLHVPYGSGNEDFSIVFLDPNGKTNTWGKAELQDGLIIPINDRFYAKADGNIFYAEFSDSNLYEINLDGQITKIFNLSIPGTGNGLKLNPEQFTSPGVFERYLYDQPFNNIIGNKNHIAIHKDTDNGRFTFLHNRNTGVTHKIRESTKLSDYGEKFNFFFQKFIGASDTELIAMLPAEKFNQIKQLAMNIGGFEESSVDHLPSVNDQDNPVLIFYDLD